VQPGKFNNHRATLKNEHLRELICTASTYCADFQGLVNQTKT